MGADKGTSMAAVGDEIGGGVGDGMQCSDHPHRNNPGGICAFCLQEKLGKLVSSSTPSYSIPIPSSSSSTPSFRSDYGMVGPTTTRTAVGGGGSGGGARSKVPFLSSNTTTQKKKHSGGGVGKVIATHSASSSTTTATTSFAAATKDVGVLKRSKSVAPRPVGGILPDATIDSPRKRRFWSFLNKRSSDLKYQQQKQQEAVGEQNVQDVSHQSKADQEVGESPSSGRKVSRSRSVGCGSRSFSGDFLERISTGFGDCTLRRVESHRESSKKAVVLRDSNEQRIIKERVKCGGIFGGFGMISLSSSYWLSAAASTAAEEDEDFDRKIVNGSNTSRASTASIVRGAGGGKGRYWSWAFASPVRAFRPAITSASSSSSKSYEAKNGVTNFSNGKITNGSNGNVSVNPSQLAVGS